MIIYILIILLGLLADQLVKWWSITQIPFEHVRTIIPGLVGLTRINNHGAAYNLFSGKMLLFYGVTLIVVVCLGYMLFKGKDRSPWLLTSLSLLIAGSLGNVCDRLFRGYVVDMIALSLGNWPLLNFVCNIADILITVGVVLLVIYLFKSEQEES